MQTSLDAEWSQWTPLKMLSHLNHQPDPYLAVIPRRRYFARGTSLARL